VTHTHVYIHMYCPTVVVIDIAAAVIGVVIADIVSVVVVVVVFTHSTYQQWYKQPLN